MPSSSFPAFHTEASFVDMAAAPGQHTDHINTDERDVFVSKVRTQARIEETKQRRRQDKMRRTKREATVTMAMHVYSIPPYSYFVPLGERQAQRRRLGQEVPTSDSDAGGERMAVVPPLYAEEEVEPSTARPHDYRPSRVVGKPVHLSQSSLLESSRYRDGDISSLRIPLYEQACHKYIFRDLFDPGFQLMELFFLVLNVGMVIVNIAMTVVNVFFNSDTVFLSWVRVSATVVFAAEFGVVMAMLLGLLLILLHAWVTNNVGTNLAADVSTVINAMATFSIFRVLGLASPTFAGRRILPFFMSAVQWTDMVKGAFFVLVWLCMCGVAFVVLITKVSQIGFTLTTSITEWSFPNFVQLLGFLMNVARVDDAYLKEVSVLLDAVHRHYLLPGEPAEAKPTEAPCLYALVSKVLGIPQYQYYDFFNTIFNRHFDWHLQADVKSENKKRLEELEAADDRAGLKKFWKRRQRQWAGSAYCAECPPPLPLRKRLRKFATYLAFIFQIDTLSLRRYLQMTQSPLPFYQLGRRSFEVAFVERDKTGMDSALWRSDPTALETRRHARRWPGQFNLRYECEEREDIWDAEYEARNNAADVKLASELADEIVAAAKPMTSTARE